MIIIALVASGLVLGILLTILVTGKLMSNPTSRIRLSHWFNLTTNRVPEGCTQLVRHGKWTGPHHGRDEP
jgi:hypothetical protein